MRCIHGSVDQQIDDTWWSDAGMVDFQPNARSYSPKVTEDIDRDVELIAIVDVEPLERKLSHGVFNDSAELGSARERVTQILRGFKAGAKIPPVLIDRLEPPARYLYRLRNGAHRFYCALAAGFTHVPAIVYEPSEWKRT